MDFFERFVVFDESIGEEKQGVIKKNEQFRKIVDIQRTFLRLWRDVRDYRKFKEMVISQDIRFDKCKILCVGQRDEHAEMRLLGYLLNKPGIFSIGTGEALEINEPLYLGISKLCCPYCVVTLNVFNKNLTSTEKVREQVVYQVGDENYNDEIEYQ